MKLSKEQVKNLKPEPVMPKLWAQVENLEVGEGVWLELHGMSMQVARVSLCRKSDRKFSLVNVDGKALCERTA